MEKADRRIVANDTHLNAHLAFEDSIRVIQYGVDWVRSIAVPTFRPSK